MVQGVEFLKLKIKMTNNKMINNVALKSCNKILTNYNNVPTYDKT
jgi:hypothetical protein